MARCPLCSERSAKRFCPAKQTTICAVCCGTKREIEIDCPGSCVHLKAGSSYEADRKPIDTDLLVRVRSFPKSFINEYGPVLEAIGRSVAEERQTSPWLADVDVMEVYKALAATMTTLSSGIYYETLPDGPARLSLFRRLKTLLDGLLSSNPDAQHRALRVSEVLDILAFLLLAATLNTSGRPKSRQYLDWLSAASGVAEPSAGESSRLILP
jgi:hypothetical protein